MAVVRGDAWSKTAWGSDDRHKAISNAQQIMRVYRRGHFVFNAVQVIDEEGYVIWSSSR